MTKEKENVTSKEACCEALRIAERELGRAPTMREYDDMDMTPCAATITRRCGTWTAALREADITPTHRFDYTVAECHQAIREVNERVPDGYVLSNKNFEEFRDDEHPSYTTIRKVCGDSFASVRDDVLGT